MPDLTYHVQGYDTILIGNFFAYPEFTRKFGQFVDDNGQHQLTAAWQAGLGNASIVGCFFGGLANGWLVSRFGQKRVVLAALVVLSAFIFITFFAQNIIMLIVGQILAGLPWGVFVTSAPAYASEVLPLSLRVYFTSWTNMCFIIGQLIAAGVLAGLVSRPDEWSYRIPFAIQWVWPALLIPVLSFAPESPWHLVRVGKVAEAEASLMRLQRASATSERVSVQATLAEIIHTNNTEIELSAGTSYLDCFRGTELRRTEIACAAFAGQVLSGSTFAYNSTVSTPGPSVTNSTANKPSTSSSRSASGRDRHTTSTPEALPSPSSVRSSAGSLSSPTSAAAASTSSVSHPCPPFSSSSASSTSGARATPSATPRQFSLSHGRSSSSSPSASWAGRSLPRLGPRVCDRRRSCWRATLITSWP
jgi:SP family general alpha glucoside:H+ symporter-like MFS transporter